MKIAIQQTSSGFGRIVQGKTAIGPIPWQVQLRKGSLSSFIFFCGGTIIDAKTILTAAHCFDGKDIDADDYFIYAGAVPFHDRTVFAQNVYAKPKSIIIHESYCNKACAAKGGEKNNNDIAIIKLKTPLIFDDKVQPACLPDAFFKAEGISVGSGWGFVSQTSPKEGKYPENLQVCINKKYPLCTYS